MDAEAFYARIAASLGAPGAPFSPAARPAERRDAKPCSAAQRQAWLTEYAERLAAVGGVCERLPAERLAVRMRELFAGERVVHVARRLLPAAAAPALEGALDCGDATPAAWREACAAAGWGVTDALALVAETGSVLLCASKDRPRAASLLPRRHLVVAPASRLVGTLEDALVHMDGAPSQWLLVTGPSRTSDIENDLTIGVHGPGVLHVLVVDEDEA